MVPLLSETSCKIGFWLCIAGSRSISDLGSERKVDRAKGTEVEATAVAIGDKANGVTSKVSSTVTNNVSETTAKKLENVVIKENKMTTKKSAGHKGGGVTLKESSAVANDISQAIANKFENVVNSEKKKTTKKSTKSSKLKSPKDRIGNSIDKVDNGGVGFKSSIIFGNEFDVALPKRCAVSTQDASELIAKQLEDVAIAEKTDKKVKTSKLPSSKSKEKASSDKSSKMDFESSVNITDSVNPIPPETSSSSSMVGITKQPAERSKDDVHVKNNTGLVGYDESDNVSCSEGIDLKKKEARQGTRLKSSLKTSRSKGANRSVNWADEKNNEALEDNKDRSIADENNDEALDHKKDKLQVVQEEDSESSLRLTSAEACAAALAQAAEAVAAGEVDAADAGR